MTQVDPKDIKDALEIAAQLVVRDGPAFLPVFLRLERELAATHKQSENLARARAVAGEADQGRSDGNEYQPETSASKPQIKRSKREDRLQRALECAAELVTRCGDDFLPAYIRVEQELETLAAHKLAAARARALA